eukprot:1149716-Pelagomonas_calceolata.AAC.3
MATRRVNRTLQDRNSKAHMDQAPRITLAGAKTRCEPANRAPQEEKKNDPKNRSNGPTWHCHLHHEAGTHPCPQIRASAILCPKRVANCKGSQARNQNCGHKHSLVPAK